MPRKKTQEEVLSEFFKAHGNYYDYSLVKYINTSTKVKVICPEHGVFGITPGHHKKGVGCRQCYFKSQKITKEEFIRRSQEHFGNRYDYSLFDQLPSSGEKVPIICIEHDEHFLQEPRNHIKGHTGCSVCKSFKLLGYSGGIGLLKTKKECSQDFVKRAQEVHGNIYDYSEFEYINSKTKGKIICSIHGDFWQTPSNHLKSIQCPKCVKANQQRNFSHDFIRRAQELHENIYDYSEFEYINSNIKGKIICLIHGEFWQTPSNHLKGHNCPQCAIEKKKQNTFKKLCSDKGVDYYRALKRRQAGLSEEKIFEEGFIRNSREVNLIKVYGETYPNLEEAVRILQPPASSATIRRWIETGITLEDAFERIPNPGYAKGIIYLIKNRITEKQYVGLTIQTLERRWKYHIEQAKANHIKNDESLHAAIREYGEEAFNIKAIDRGTTKKDLEGKERHWIKKLKTLVPLGYNICTGGVSGGSSKKPTTIDGIRFESVKQAAEYVAKSRDISVTAAKKRISLGRIDVKKPAKPGESIVYTKAYQAWRRIIDDALNPKSKDYIPEITIYENWRNFQNFFQDIGNPPQEGMAFVRLDKSKGFFPDNCKWMTKSDASKINAEYMKKMGLFRKKKSSIGVT